MGAFGSTRVSVYFMTGLDSVNTGGFGFLLLRATTAGFRRPLERTEAPQVDQAGQQDQEGAERPQRMGSHGPTGLPAIAAGENGLERSARPVKPLPGRDPDTGPLVARRVNPPAQLIPPPHWKTPAMRRHTLLTALLLTVAVGSLCASFLNAASNVINQIYDLEIDRLAQRRRIPRNDQQHARTLRRDQAVTNRIDVVVIFEFDNLNGVHMPVLLKPASSAAYICVQGTVDGATSIQ